MYLISEQGNTLSVDLSDRVSSREAFSLRCDLISSVEKKQVETVEFNMGKLQFIDNILLGILIIVLRKVSARNGKILIIEPNHDVKNVFKIARLDSSFNIWFQALLSTELEE